MSKHMKEYVDLPVVQSHLRGAAAFVGQKAQARFLEWTDRAMRYTRQTPFESPLELLFWLWWSACEDGNNFYPFDRIRLEPQVEVEAGGDRYRLDFVVMLFEPNWQKVIDAGAMVWPKIAVEVDGHAFHERTPEQVALRDRRDRALQQAGWLVFHYSWTEFTTAPQRCVEEVYDLATTTVNDLYRQYSQDISADLKGE